MLGFSTFSQTTFSQSATTLAPFIDMPAATAAFILSVFGVDAKANVTTTDVSSSFSISSLDFDAQASITTGSIASTFSISDFDDILLTANITPDAVTALFELDIDFDAEANTSIGGSVSATLAASDFDSVRGFANIEPSAITATLSSNAFEEVTGSAFVTSPSVLLTTATNLDNPTAVRFDFGPFADSYDRGRIVYLVSYGGSDTVHVTEESRVVYIDAYPQNYTVHITEENRTVYIEKDTQNRTVYIAA